MLREQEAVDQEVPGYMKILCNPLLYRPSFSPSFDCPSAWTAILLVSFYLHFDNYKSSLMLAEELLDCIAT